MRGIWGVWPGETTDLGKAVSDHGVHIGVIVLSDDQPEVAGEPKEFLNGERDTEVEERWKPELLADWEVLLRERD